MSRLHWSLLGKPLHWKGGCRIIHFKCVSGGAGMLLQYDQRYLHQTFFIKYLGHFNNPGKNYRHSTTFTYCQHHSKMAVFACSLFFLMISKFKSIGLPMNSILMESIIDKNQILLFIHVKWTLWTFSWLKVTDFSKITKKSLPHQLHYSVFPSCPVFRSSLGNHR